MPTPKKPTKNEKEIARIKILLQKAKDDLEVATIQHDTAVSMMLKFAQTVADTVADYDERIRRAMAAMAIHEYGLQNLQKKKIKKIRKA